MHPTGHPSAAPLFAYNGAAGETKQTLFEGRGNLFSVHLDNNHSAAVYIQFFDKLADDVTVGTTAPDFTMMLPASSSRDVVPEGCPIRFFGIGCVYAVTAARTDATAPGADASVSFRYAMNP